MTPEEIAQQHDDRPGYRIVDFEEVGLPIYKVRSIVLTLEPKTYSAIEEFVLRSVDTGLIEPQDISGFLGLNLGLVETTASSLLRDDAIKVNQDGTLSLTEKSKMVLRGERLKTPREQAVVFWFDGLTRRPITPLPSLEPRFLKKRGIREIRPFPPKRPDADEISAEDLQKVLQHGRTSHGASIDVLQVQSVDKAYMYFVPATALIFRSDTKPEVQVAFAVDGRLSKEHETAFASSDGPQRTGMEAAIVKATAEKDESGLNLPIGPLRGPLSSALQRRQDAAERFESRFSGRSEPNSDSPTEGVEMVSVYQHPKLLQEALSTCRQRLIIISPWITPAVVDREFLANLTRLIDANVQVYIGYGLGEGNEHSEIERTLESISKANARFTFARLGDTHAKILIKDSDYIVTTSFNWLSFRGDPKRPFREEWGMKVSIAQQVDIAAERFIRRISDVETKR